MTECGGPHAWIKQAPRVLDESSTGGGGKRA
jgi:hypothetical protein